MTEWIKLTSDDDYAEDTALYYYRETDEAPHKFAFGAPNTREGATPWDKGITHAEALAFAQQLPEVKALAEAGRALLVEAVEVNYRVEDVPVGLWEKLAVALAAWDSSPRG